MGGAGFKRPLFQAAFICLSLSPLQCFTLLGVTRKCTPSPTFEAVKPAVISLSGPLSPAKEDVYFVMCLMNQISLFEVIIAEGKQGRAGAPGCFLLHTADPCRPAGATTLPSFGLLIKLIVRYKCCNIFLGLLKFELSR